MPRLEIALRSPLAFWRRPEVLTAERMKEGAQAVAIECESRRFVWHPPIDRSDELGLTQYGPMVVVGYQDDEDAALAAEVTQRFLSAVAFHWNEAVEDEGVQGGSGESDLFNPHGHRSVRAYASMHLADAPTAIAVERDPNLDIALAYYRESANAGSRFYRFLACWNA